MGFDFSKRISGLREQTGDEKKGRISYPLAFVGSFVIFLCLFSFIRLISPAEVPESLKGRTEVAEATLWREQTIIDIQDRYSWLENSIFGRSAADKYLKFSQGVVGDFRDVFNPRKGERDFGDSWLDDATRTFVGSYLRIGFIFAPFFPFWIIAVILGYFCSGYFYKPARTNDVLGIATPGKGPFYSGVWGVFKPNKSLSGTDYAVPSLACPELAPKKDAQAHKLKSILKKYNAANETNLGLIQVILKYSDYPSLVPEERSSDEVSDHGTGAGEEAANAAPVTTGLVSTDCKNIEQASLEGLLAVLEAYSIFVRYRQEVQKAGDAVKKEDFYKKHMATVEHVSKSVSPLAVNLLYALTPERALAISDIPIAAIATACLAVEAGKSLTFERVSGGNFSQISQFPQLQARAVMQSMPSYVHEYDGDVRLQIRQSVICARRHGDFGRMFLPINMTPASKALRDWLEVLYAEESIRDVSSKLVELDGHFDSFHAYWRQNLIETYEAEKSERDPSLKPWLGITYKSVVLTPLRGVIKRALKEISPARQKRVSQLMEETRERQKQLSVSAGLPGFKRLASDEAHGGAFRTGITKKLFDSKEDKSLAIQWTIVRRMLTAYNWLSTRIGDDAVPSDGLLQAVLTTHDESGKKEAVGLDAVVPLRLRRFRVLFGQEWEHQNFSNGPSERDVSVIVNPTEYQSTLEKHQNKAKAQEQSAASV